VDDGIREQAVSCDAAEGDTTEGMGKLGQSMDLGEMQGMESLMKHHKDCLIHKQAYTRLGRCWMCRFLLQKSLAVRMFLSNDVS
jgi:hypothetical protein